MTTHCSACGRVLKRDPIMVNDLPMGPVCAAKAPAVAPAGRDLFGYDTEAAAASAGVSLRYFIWYAGLTAQREIARGFAESRGRLGL